MQPLNIFLRGFFSSKLPAQCSPSSHYVLLLPSTEHLLTHKEHETQAQWEDLVASEEILASHVIRVPPGSASSHAKEGASLRDTKGKARQFTTLNGKTVVVKDNFVYSNKGFKSLNQAQLLQDVLYYPNVPQPEQWLIYYISKPLVGTPEPLYGSPLPLPQPLKPDTQEGSSQSKHKEIKAFNDLLNNFPIIAKQMLPGLERLFQQFTAEADGTFNSDSASQVPSRPSTPSESTRSRHRRRSVGSLSSFTTLDGAQSLKSSLRSDDPAETGLRQALETLVLSAIDLFQAVDKNQLSYLGASTSLSGPVVERMIERYVSEHFHDKVLFPRLCELRKSEDTELEACTKSMGDIDLSQVGVAIEGGVQGRRELSLRIKKGVDTFKKMGVAGSPQEMIEVLLETAKCIMTASDSDKTGNAADEKPRTEIMTNADLLVSMLLIVVIRSPVRHLHARLVYMSEFTFIGDVETGEIGYALSTFEAVLSYLVSNSGPLRRASQANRALWKACKNGNLTNLKGLLEQDQAIVDDLAEPLEPILNGHSSVDRDTDIQDWINSDNVAVNGDLSGEHGQETNGSAIAAQSPAKSGLAHVFPFEAQSEVQDEPRPKIKKKVSMSMDARSMSSSSAASYLSRASTIKSTLSMKADTSVEQLSQTRDAAGNSLLMMAVEHCQTKALQYFLQLPDLFPVDNVLEDRNDDGTTLLAAALQTGHKGTINSLVDFILNGVDETDTLRAYVARQDAVGRSAAHYLFNAPELIPLLSRLLPWRMKDKNGQTPLFAVCRSYDRDDYSEMVDAALAAAQETQDDNELLHLDLHSDGKSNTLLHVANDSRIIRKLLRECDADPNAKNDKNFTPLMVASKFARLDTVRALFNDERIDLFAHDHRGLTAVELAKDDEVRNRMDDMVLLSARSVGEDVSSHRVTTIVRSFFVEDASIRLVLKSGAPNPASSTITVTTCRRSLQDFENLARWLALEQPASWLPSLTYVFRNPFQIPSRPSRTVLRDIQLRLDSWLRTLLTHSTFATHEMLWEFFLVPDIDKGMLAQRARDKASLRTENLRQDFAPIPSEATPSVELFVAHATDQVRAVHDAVAGVSRSLNALRSLHADLVDAHALILQPHLAALTWLPVPYQTAMKKHVAALADAESNPLLHFHHHLISTQASTSAILAALARPTNLIASLHAAEEQLGRHESAALRSMRWPSALGLLDDARRRLTDDSVGKAERARQERDDLGRELAYAQQTVAAELAGFWEVRGGRGAGARGKRGEGRGGSRGIVIQALKELARGMVVRERERLERFRRAGREIGVDTFAARTAREQEQTGEPLG